MLAILFALVFVIVIGLLFVGLTCFILSSAISLGFFSISALIAWYNKSVSLGIRWFLQLLFVVPGMMVGVLGFYVYQWLFHSDLSFSLIILCGIVMGALGGFISGSLAFIAIRQLFRILQSK
jgi:hypothetical protein